MRKAVSVEVQLAVTLYYLADEGRLRKFANAFGLAKSTVSVIIRRVTSVISWHLGPKYMGPVTDRRQGGPKLGIKFLHQAWIPTVHWCCRWDTFFY